MSYRRLAGFALILIALCMIIAQAERVQWFRSMGSNGHYYEAVKVPECITWDEAKGAAEAMGGHLVTIGSSKENQFVYGLVANDPGYWSRDGKNGEGPWLGGYKNVKNVKWQEWAWVTEESFSYANWASGEPNNFQGIEDKLLFFGEGSLQGPKWNDGSSSFKARGYIVEWEPQEEERDPGYLAVPGQTS